MNRIFKIIWNKTTQRQEVVSELAKGAVKSSSTSSVNKSQNVAKSIFKLSLISMCLGYSTLSIAHTVSVEGNVKYGDYGIAIGGYNGGAQVGPKPQNGTTLAAVGDKQISIGHDQLVASGHSSIVIGSDYGDKNKAHPWGLTYRQAGTQGFNTIGIGSGTQSIGLNTLALGALAGSGVGYQGYDDAVYLGSYSRIASKGFGRTESEEDIRTLNNNYSTAVETFNQARNAANLQAIKDAGRAINNVALNKVEGMTIKSNVENSTPEGSTFTTQTGQVSQINGSSGTTTVSILSVGGKDGNNTMYRQIQNVAAGRIASDSNDAVTGSQLYYVRNYTGWNIGHYDDVTKSTKTTGRVNNDHTVVFKPGDYTDVYTTLDSTDKSSVNIEVKTASLSTEVANGKISKVLITEPVGKDANKTVARTAGVKSVLDKFNEIKADKVDIMGYSHVNETDADKVTENRIITAKNWENQFNNNNGTYHESAGAKGNRAITSGVRANALANDSIAIGSLANVNNNWGEQSVAAERSIAIGREATVNAGQDSIAMGSGAQILHSDATTLNANNSIAIGKLSKIDQASNAIALGNKASVGGNYSANRSWYASDNSIAIGNETTVSRENSIGIGTNVSVARENSVVIGQNASATRERVVAIGAYAKAEGDRTVAIGPEATASASRSIVIGGLGDNPTDNKAKSEEGATQAIVIGNGAQAKAAASYSITLGNSAKTEAVTGISIGDRANVASGANSGIALGKSAVANKSGDIAIGESSSTSAKHTVSGLKIGDATLSTGVAATDNGTVSFGNNDVKRQIQNVGAGEISETSSDVITGSQLYHVIKAADEIAKTKYTFKVKGTDIKTMSNNGTSATNNANNTLDFRAGDGLDVAYENNAVTYKLNADSKKAIADAKTAATTVTNSLQEINRSVARAETAAGTATEKAAEATTAAGKAKDSETAAAGSAKTASDKAAEAAGSAQTATEKAAEATTAAGKAKDSENTVKMIKDRIEGSGLINADGETSFASNNAGNRKGAKASGKDSTAMGYGSEAEGDHSTALGNNAKAHAERSTAIGHNAEVKAKAAGSVALGEGSVAEEKDTISVGNVGHERRITNVQDPKNLTDAANKRYVDHSVNSVRNELKQTDRKLRGGIAGAVAMANIPTTNRAGSTMVGVGVGNFKGQNAVAIGLSKSSDNNRIHFKVSGSATSAGDYAVGGGIGYQW